MNAERLHALIIRVIDELEATSVVSNLQALSTALQGIVTQSNAQTQQQLSSALIAFRAGLKDSSISNWSPAWLELLVEIGADEVLGARLGQAIDTIMATNAITPAVAKTQIDKIRQDLEGVNTAVIDVQSGLANLNIGQEELEPGECEVGFLIPRRAVKNELGGLAS